MNKDDILKEIERISVETTDNNIKLNALIFLYNNLISQEIKAETDKFNKKSMEYSKKMNELLSKSLEFNYGGE